jgi:hypothetical protein
MKPAAPGMQQSMLVSRRIVIAGRIDKGAGIMTRVFVLVASVCTVVALTGCYVPSPKISKTVTETVSGVPGDADSVDVSLALGVGKIAVSGGSAGLYDAEFRYNIPDWKPEVSYEVSKRRGTLAIEQPSGVVGATWPGNVRYEWSIKLSDKVPMTLKVDMGAGKVDLDLRSLQVTKLDIDAGVGEGLIDLSGERAADLEAKIEAGVGSLTVILPRTVGVRAEVSGGIGEIHSDGLKQNDEVYSNDAWDGAGAKIRLQIEGGIGEVRLELADSTGKSIQPSAL